MRVLRSDTGGQRPRSRGAFLVVHVLQAEAGEGGPISLPTPVPAVPVPNPAPIIEPLRGLDTPKTPWLLLGVGVFLAIAGVIALLAAFGPGS